ncbi:hypothetical protein PBCV1_a307aR [Paramecium bursaria Chlorella virus 1]|uniref:Uncharacterized protein n=1 Tax=Paramecium bursaria Chlorella virus 1 TaxID=10506 RepID=Q84623_PBCV1|nr:hypothetical protein PBCV1_a307aR [Paramecium bursaria Chlorella virus 1]AAC96675.2 hypothetical protein [Paramecium bursaria Chlorella virus 1]
MSLFCFIIVMTNISYIFLLKLIIIYDYTLVIKAFDFYYDAIIIVYTIICHIIFKFGSNNKITVLQFYRIVPFGSPAYRNT